MKKKTVILAAAGAAVLTAVGGAAIALPGANPNSSPSKGSGAGYGTPFGGQGQGQGDGHGRDGERGADRTARLEQALAPLVSAKTITQKQADSIATTLSTRPANATRPSNPPSQADRSTRLKARLAPLVADKTLTQAQADTVAKTLVETMPGGFGKGGRHGGPGGSGGGELMQAAATELDLTADELRTKLREGKTLGQLIDAAGKSRTAVVDAAYALEKTELAQRVKDGHLTQAQADAHLADFKTRASAALDQTRPGRGHDRQGSNTDPGAKPSPSPTTTS